MADQWYVQSFPPTTFPLAVGFPFYAASLYVTNNYGGTIYLSRTNPTPGPLAYDVLVAPRTSRPVFSWNADQMYVGGGSSPAVSGDAIDVQASNAVQPFPAGSLLLRQNYYDRNPLVVTRSFFGAALAPHVQVMRWSYTVPVNRKFFLEVAFAQVIRSGAGATFGFINDWVGIASDPAYYFSAATTAVNPPDRQVSIVGAAGYFNAGDSLQGWTVDNSNGGDGTHWLNIKGTEYDA